MSKKQGLHGWRAFLVIVISGTLAGFLFVAIAFGSVRSVLSGFSSSGAGGGGVAIEARKPRESIAPGVLDLCELVESQSLMSASSVNRTDSRDSYRDDVDPVLRVRTVEDDCTWEVVGAGGHLWDFNLSYVAFVEDGEKSSKEEMSVEEFSRRVEGASTYFSSISSESGSAGDGEWISYGEFEEGVDGYVMIKKVKSGVFEVKVSGGEGVSVLEQDFRVEVRKIVPYLDRAFVSQIPD